MNEAEYTEVCRKSRDGFHLDDLFAARKQPEKLKLPTDKNGVVKINN